MILYDCLIFLRYCAGYGRAIAPEPSNDGRGRRKIKLYKIISNRGITGVENYKTEN